MGVACVVTADERAAGMLAPEKVEQIVAEFDRSVILVPFVKS